MAVDGKRVHVERSRKFGGPWLGLEPLRRLELHRFPDETLPAGPEEIPWPPMATVPVLGQLCARFGELGLAERFHQSSTLVDRLGVPAGKVNEDRLYRALDALLPHQPALEKHRKDKLGEPFELDYDLLLYDATSTSSKPGRRSPWSMWRCRRDPDQWSARVASASQPSTSGSCTGGLA
ncbi:MAG: hypothetical protein ACLQGV_08450 [Bryobacteraceae bacterium]